MGLLDDLKKQSAEQKAKEQSERELKEQQFAFFKEEMQPKLEAIYSYLQELSEHLNYIEREITVSYSLGSNVTLSDLRQQDYVLKINRRENMSEMALRFHCRGEDAMCIKAENESQFNQLKELFYQNRLDYQARETRDERRNVLGGDITVQKDIPVLFQFDSDIENGCIVLKIRNFEHLGIRKILLFPRQIDEAFLDSLGRYLLREVDTFMQLSMEEEHRNRLKESVEQENLSKQQELELAEQRRLEEEQEEKKKNLAFRVRQQVKDIYGKVKKGES